MHGRRRLVSFALLAACSRSPPVADPSVVLTPPSATGSPEPTPVATADAGEQPTVFEIEYSTFSLMPAPTCGGATFIIRVDRDRRVHCGWASECPLHTASFPLKPAEHGRLDAEQVDRLLAIAGSPSFLKLPSFSSNPAIIDGGEERMVVRCGDQSKTVEMANTTAAPFASLLEALESASGCSIAKAGPRPR